MTFVTSEVVCEAAGRGWIRCWSALSKIVANGAGIDLVPCVAVAGYITWSWVIFPLPIGWMGPGIGVTCGVGATGGGDTPIKVNSARGSMALLAKGEVVFCIRAMQTGFSIIGFVNLTWAAWVTPGLTAVGIGKSEREATRSTAKGT